MGRALLLQGDKDGAREHAVQALRADPTAPDALALLTSIKTRANPFLGAWWHYATWLERIGPARSVIVLLAAFVLYRVAVISAEQDGAAGLAQGIQLAWLAVVAYMIDLFVLVGVLGLSGDFDLIGVAIHLWALWSLSNGYWTARRIKLGA